MNGDGAWVDAGPEDWDGAGGGAVAVDVLGIPRSMPLGPTGRVGRGTAGLIEGIYAAID